MIGLPLFSWLLTSGMDRQLLTRLLSEASGMQVEFDTYSLSRSGRAEIGNLRVRTADQDVLRVQTLSASFSWWSLLKRKPEISDLTLNSPELTLSDSLISELQSQPKTESRDLSIDFHNAKVVYRREGEPFSLDGLQGHLSGREFRLSSSGGFEGSVSWGAQSSHYKFENLSLQILGSLAGRDLPNGTVDFDLQHNGQDLRGEFAIDSALLKGKVATEVTVSTPAVKGTITSEALTVMGCPFSRVNLPFSWEEQTFSIDNATLNTDQGDFRIDGVVSQGASDLTLAYDKWTVRVKGARPVIAVSALWDETSILDSTLKAEPWTLDVTNVNGGYLMRKFGMDGVGFDFSGRLTYQDSLSGELTSVGGRLQGQTVGETTLKLEANSSEDVRLTGSSSVAKQPVTFDAQLSDQGWLFSAKGQDIPAKLLRPDAGGKLDLEGSIRYPAGLNSFAFSYTGDDTYPAVLGRGQMTDGLLVFDELTLPKLEPPLNARGSYRRDNESVNLQTELKGQQVANLWSGSPVRGQLFGQAKLQGSVSAPKPTFEGELREASWDKIELGTVAITAEEAGIRATITDVSLAAVPALGSQVSGLGSISIEGLPPKLKGKADFPSVAWSGQELGQLQASFHLEDESLIIDSLTLPSISVTGSATQEALSFRAQIEKLDLGRLPLPETVTGLATGTLSVSGSPSNPTGQFQGSVQKLVCRDIPLGDLPLQASMRDGVVKAEVLGLAVEKLEPVAKALPELKGVLDLGLVLVKNQPNIEGRLVKGTYGDIPLPPISTTLLYTSEEVKIQRLTLEQATPLTLSGSFSPGKGTFQLSSRLEKVALDPVLALLPSSPSVTGTVSGHLSAEGDRTSAKLNFQGSGRSISVSGVGIGNIPEITLSATAAGGFTFQAKELAALGIEPLRGLYPNLQGQASFQAVRDPRTGTLDLSGNLTKSHLPDLSFQARWNGSELVFSSMKAALDPPVVISGVVKDGALDLAGVLKGQTMQDLVKLGGAKPSPEIQANLAGNFRLLGPLQNPTATLVGPVSHMRYRNSNIGSGQLSLTINQRLQGELTLDQPYDATLSDAAPGSVTQVPAINSILKSAIKARITAVTISGTPAEPKVSPVVVGVGVATKIQLPTQIKLPNVQTQLPGVLEKAGVKIPVLKSGGAQIQIPGTGQSIKIKTGIFD
jgi:hypothetical protein